MTILYEVERVSKKYDRGHIALQDISFTINKGDIYGIIGQSGAGKSTLFRLLSSLLSPTQGRILFHGIDIASFNLFQLRAFRKTIGMIFQHFHLFSSRTVAENIAYPLEISHLAAGKRKKKVEELLDLVGLASKRDFYPPALSGGEKQRVGIARALAGDPEVLFCDEATSALDPITTKEILTFLRRIHKELHLTIVFITHEMEVIKSIGSRVAILDQGRLVEEGEVAEVFANPQHTITRNFLQHTAHELPVEFLKKGKKIFRLSFKGSLAGEPVISRLVRQFDVDANILQGWIDCLSAAIVGILIVELCGKEENITQALQYLKQKKISYELL